MKIKELAGNTTVVVGDLSGSARTLPTAARQEDIAHRVFRGSSLGIVGYLAHHKPVVSAQVALPCFADGTVETRDHRVSVDFGGAMRRGWRPTDQVAALLACMAPQAIALDILDAEDAQARPALKATLVADGLAILMEASGPFAELDLGTKAGLDEARTRLADISPDSALAAPAKRELLQGAAPVLLPAVSVQDQTPAMPVTKAPGIANTMTSAELASMRCEGIGLALALIEGAGDEWRARARDLRDQISACVAQAVQTVAEEMKPLAQAWLTLAQSVRMAQQYCEHPVATLDLAVDDLTKQGDDRTPMADEDGLWFQRELFNAAVTPMSAVDLTPSAAMVLLAEPVATLSQLKAVGRYAEDARTMVFASLDPDSLTGLRATLNRDAFDKDEETWKRHVAVFAPSIQIAPPEAGHFALRLPAASAVVARLIEVKTQPAGPDEEAGEIAKAVVGPKTPVLVNGAAMPGAIPGIIVNDRAMHQRMTNRQVSLLYHSDQLGTFASDANTLYCSSNQADEIYGVSTATMLMNYLTRTITHHMRLQYDGQPGTVETAQRLETEIRGLIKALDDGTKGSSRKIVVAEQTDVSVTLVENGSRLDVKLKVGIPNLVTVDRAADVTAHTAVFDLCFDLDASNWQLSA